MQNYYAKGELLTTLQGATVQRNVMAVGVYAGGAPAVLKENGTLTYGAAGPLYEVPALANAHEVAQATARGESIQGMSPGMFDPLPLRKIELHDMDYAIAGMEQQKADDLAVIDRNLNQ
jgi:hypothetical protein